MLPYTSGSTGLPKGVPLTHAGLIWCFDAQRKVMMVDHTERALVAVPAYHVNGMAGALAPSLLAGGSVVFLPGFEPLAVIEAIARHRVTFMPGVPAMYYALLDQRDAVAAHDLSSLRFVSIGSATAPPELLRRIGETFGVPVLEGYGLTEGGPVCAKLPRLGIRKPGSCGLPFPGAEIKVMALDGAAELAPDEVGELWVRTPGNTRGYYKRPDLTAERLLPDGWLKTGDLGRKDADGYLYFAGRKDDMINCGGENVYPKEVEDLLLRHPAVAAACVVPAPHPTKGQAPVAYVVPRDGLRIEEPTLKQFCLEHGPAYAHPRRVYLLDALPLTGVGKPDRTELTRRAATP